MKFTPIPAIKTRGVTLIEIALCMMILSILSVAVSNLVLSGVQSQMNQRIDENLQLVAMNIVEDIRLDLRHSAATTVLGGGNTLRIVRHDGSIVTYQLTGANNFQRTDTGTGLTKTYNDPTMYTTPPLQVRCVNNAGANSACFQAQQMNNDATPQPREILLQGLRVEAAVPSNTVVEQNFGAPNFTVRNFSFDVMSATEFQ